MEEVPIHPIEPVSLATDMIFIGSGGTPSIGCLLKTAGPCAVCKDSLLPVRHSLKQVLTSLQGSKNRRRNPSVLIRHRGANILIDCGKTFRESMLREIVEHKVMSLDALIITHGHADAINGLDDLREFRSPDGDVVPMPLFIRQHDLNVVAQAFPYIIDSARATGSGFVSKIEPHIINEVDSFDVCGITFHTILLDHGYNSTALGFRFGDVAYLSDLVRLSDTSREKLLALGPIDLLVIDALFVDRANALKESIVEIKRLKPKHALLVGMSHEFDYHSINQKVKSLQETDNIILECAYDGQVVPIPSLTRLPHNKPEFLTI